MKERRMREHGGNLDVARQRFGGAADDWIDLSTGINRVPYPLVDVEPRQWSALPSRSDLESLHDAARQAYVTKAPIVAMGGAQAAIQLLPHLALKGRARILAPTYNEYAAVLSAAGWDVAEVSDLAALAGADIAVVVNPNNPDGRRHDRRELLALLPRVGRLVIDESFADAVPDLSLAPEAGRAGLLILRSFGKFYGLAGLRLGFAIGSEADIAALAAMAGPLAGFGSSNRDRAARVARSRLGNGDGCAARGRLRQARCSSAIAGLDAGRRHVAVPALRDRRSIGCAGETCACADLAAGLPAETGMAAPRLAGQ
ncbi:histidinol-phosphate/aromatic aminotransferase/cobyric acid decarboxylase-like protein [Bradyrhizobium sp. USDA 4519]